MGSWYNTIGYGRETKQLDDPLTCTIKKCGNPPANVLSESYRNWNKCAMQYSGFCSKKFDNTSEGNRNVNVPSSMGTLNINVEEKEIQNKPLPAETPITTTQTSGNGLSTNMKIGLAVGALAVIGLVMFFRRK